APAPAAPRAPARGRGAPAGGRGAAAAGGCHGDLVQQGPELRRGGTAGRVLDQQAGQDRGQGAPARGGGRGGGDDGAEGLELAPAEGWLALDREPEGGAQRPQVGGR